MDRSAATGAELTTLRVGGPLENCVRVASADECLDVLRQASPDYVLGGGSNLVIADAGLRGSVLVLRSDRAGIVELSSGGPSSEANVRLDGTGDLDTAITALLDEGYFGIESLSGIPGTTGGAVVQNVGAYGYELGEFVVGVDVFDRATATRRRLDADECDFHYRSSRFKDADRGRFVILAVDLRLTRDATHVVRYPEVAGRLTADGHADKPADPREVRRVVRDLRAAKGMIHDADDPATWGAGSFFTNPVVGPEVADGLDAAQHPNAISPPRWETPSGKALKLSAGWLVESAGFARGHEWSRVGLTAGHALGLVNRTGEATAADVIAAANDLARAVFDRFSIRLAAEPVFVGFGDDPPPLQFDAVLVP